MLEKYDDFLTVEELCSIMKIGRNAAYKLLSSGELASIRNGKTWIIPKQAIIDFTNRKMNEAANVKPKKTRKKEPVDPIIYLGPDAAAQ